MLGLFCVTHHSFQRALKSASACSGGSGVGSMAPWITSSGSGQGMLGLSCVTHHTFQLDANSSGRGSGVAVGGTGVAVGGLGVAVGGLGVAVGGLGVAVGGLGVAVGGTDVSVGTAVGGTAVGSGVAGIEVAVGSLPPHAASTTRAIRNGIKTRALGLTSQAWTIQLPLKRAILRGAGLKTHSVASAPTLTNPVCLCQCVWSTFLGGLDRREGYRRRGMTSAANRFIASTTLSWGTSPPGLNQQMISPGRRSSARVRSRSTHASGSPYAATSSSHQS